jgi:BirA family biotin operon repressor/biotin-[acetyl-CoA-carboxylase] ligase
MNIIKIKSTNSTNLLLKELAKKQVLESGTVLITDNQTAGRGLAGNFWESEPEKNITCSLLLHPTFLPIKQNFFLSKIIALGVKDLLDNYVQNVTIKWSNDIYVESRKIAGILIENEFQGTQFIQSIAGIGLNVNQEVFLSKTPNPISLKQILKKDLDLNVILESMIQRIMYWYDILQKGNLDLITKTYDNALYRKSGFHLYEDKNGQFSAQIESVGEDGILHLKTDTGEKRHYAFKEVSYLI